jgi:hypothetical protein
MFRKNSSPAPDYEAYEWARQARANHFGTGPGSLSRRGNTLPDGDYWTLQYKDVGGEWKYDESDIHALYYSADAAQQWGDKLLRIHAYVRMMHTVVTVTELSRTT